MKKILFFVIAIAMSFAHAGAAVRDGVALQRSGNTDQKRVSTVTKERSTVQRTLTDTTRGTTVRQPAKDTQLTDRTRSTTVTARSVQNTTPRTNTAIIARATTPQQSTIETRTGAEYETCKTAYFTCMDQFCALKNDDYRRCSCNNRVYELDKAREKLIQASEQITVFNENLDVVGLTTEQATAMRTATEGETALATDTSASKALLQAIMNSISGGDTTVGGKYSNLNTVAMSYDLSTAFGTDANQLIAMYNGQELYTNVYQKCRHAIAADCNDAALQRAITAYLMAIEQDCNTVQTAIEEKQKQTKTAIRESSAMLDLARVENRQKHNSDDLAACVNNVESAILSEEVCGENYHKCLDNGEYIDVSTGAPIVGVIKFYELGKMLTFTPGVAAANQQLADRPINYKFVEAFEKKTKKFALPALDKCTEIADTAWSEYLNKAMLAIYYAQQSKVKEVKQGCFDFITQCYENNEGAITTAMSSLIADSTIVLEPDKIALTTQMCDEYVQSCNNMFDGNIVQDYVENRRKTDNLAACRAVVRQCFDKYGGSGYENFYYPYSGLFVAGEAGDWFTLYDKTTNPFVYKSPCAIQLTTIDACNDPEIIESAFGGFDKFNTNGNHPKSGDLLSYAIADSSGTKVRYGIEAPEEATEDNNFMKHRFLRSTGVATEVYNQVISTLITQCANIGGRFIETQFVQGYMYGGQTGDVCIWSFNSANTSINSITQSNYAKLMELYGISQDGENMCPRNYRLTVDTKSWGVCSCWENGGRRSKNGKSAICLPLLPLGTDDSQSTSTSSEDETDPACATSTTNGGYTWKEMGTGINSNFAEWCTQETNIQYSQVCPYKYVSSDSQYAPQSATSTVIGCVPAESQSEETTATIDAALKLVPKSY